jgi:hypothetical protein
VFSSIRPAPDLVNFLVDTLDKVDTLGKGRWFLRRTALPHEGENP